MFSELWISNLGRIWSHRKALYEVRTPTVGDPNQQFNGSRKNLETERTHYVLHDSNPDLIRQGHRARALWSVSVS